ncbi:MAG: hypothetical protein AB7S70_11820 [Hyphomicrobium sp.]|uniref:hypothetical protein n=1 Tax=Hyphomicrobium sp. TaxID=82 RepID=UPI003D0D4D9B
MPSSFPKLALLIGAVAYLAGPARAGTDVALNRILLTAAELRGAGITFDGNGLDSWPNECGDAGNNGLAVSNDMLRHFEARGFTLVSLCLGLSGATVFDPETGKQLPVAHVTDAEFEVVLNLPDCYRNGKPNHDCEFRYSHWEGAKFDPEEVKNSAGVSAETDTMVRSYIKTRRVTGRFDIEALGHGVFDSTYSYFLATRALPRGYGYALHGGEGEDPASETVDLATYRNKPSGWSIWFDED